MATEYFNDAWRIPNNKNQSLVSNYSMDFTDIADTQINIGNSDYLTFGDNDFTYAAWINPTSFSTGFEAIYVSEANPGGVWIGKLSGTGDKFTLRQTSGTTVIAAPLPALNTWTHICITRNNNDFVLYFNGSSVATTTLSITFVQGSDVFIGSYSSTASEFNGKIDQTCIFDYGLSASQVATLYGGGTAVTNPMSLNPVSYYQLGDQSAYNGANYLVPNNSLNGSEGYSPYALSLDSNDANHFTLNNGSGNGLLNAATSFTISAWINPNQPTSFGNIFTHFIGGVMLRFTANGTIQFYVTKEDGSFFDTTAPSALTFSNNWQHVVANYDGSFLRIYVNNVLVNTPFAFSDTLKNDTSSAPDIIGNRINTTQYFDGEISNVAVWKNSVIDVNTLYNQGVPADLTSLNPSGWWQMGSNSSFDANTSKWTCLNEGTARTSTVPSNATTFAGNMTNDDIVNGVGYSGNGLGTSSIEIVGDAPYSTANGLSENMDVLDRTTDVPS